MLNIKRFSIGVITELSNSQKHTNIYELDN